MFDIPDQTVGLCLDFSDGSEAEGGNTVGDVPYLKKGRHEQGPHQCSLGH